MGVHFTPHRTQQLWKSEGKAGTDGTYSLASSQVRKNAVGCRTLLFCFPLLKPDSGSPTLRDVRRVCRENVAR